MYTYAFTVPWYKPRYAAYIESGEVNRCLASVRMAEMALAIRASIQQLLPRSHFCNSKQHLHYYQQLAICRNEASFYIYGSVVRGLYSILPGAEHRNLPASRTRKLVDPEKGRDLINYWKYYACFTLSDKSEPNIKEQCKEACFPGGVTSNVPASSLIESSQTCWLNGPESDYRTGKELTEDQKKENPRTCKLR